MKTIYWFALLITPFVTWAQMDHAPPDFSYKNSLAIFVDFQQVHHKLVYSAQYNYVVAETTIKFKTKSSGFPIFDLMDAPTEIKLNGSSVQQTLIADPTGATYLRVLQKEVGPGEHKLVIKSKVTDILKYSNGGVFHSLWFSDLSDRYFMERYLPSNLEYDHHKTTMEIKLDRFPSTHELFTNGKITTLGEDHFYVEYPAYYTSSSIFYHLSVKNYYQRIRTTYKSIDGRTIPILIYGKDSEVNLTSFKTRTLNVLAELERDYGPWPHPKFLVFASGRGGMEYSGATRTSLSALGHEMHHGYFARALMPANGNSGWMDEAMASWRDKGYLSHSVPNFEGSSMAGHSLYSRKTDRLAYSYGASFMAHLDYKLKSMGGLRSFLKDLLTKKIYISHTTPEFQNSLQEFSGFNLDSLFNQYIYGANKFYPEVFVENPFHPELTIEELRSYL